MFISAQPSLLVTATIVPCRVQGQEEDLKSAERNAFCKSETEFKQTQRSNRKAMNERILL